MLPSKVFLLTPSSNTSVGQSADCTVSLLFYPCSLTKLSFLEDHRKFYLEHSYVRPEVELISHLSLIAGGVKAILLYAGRDATESVFSITLVG